MATWRTITIADLQHARHAELVDAVQKRAKAVGQEDPIAAAIAKVVGEVRGVINFSGRYTVDEDGDTMAPNLIDLCVQKIARVLMPRIGRALTTDETAEEKIYQKRLEDLRDATWPVDASDTPATTATVAVTKSRPRICRRVRRFSHCDEDGI